MDRTKFPIRNPNEWAPLLDSGFHADDEMFDTADYVVPDQVKAVEGPRNPNEQVYRDMTPEEWIAHQAEVAKRVSFQEGVDPNQGIPFWPGTLDEWEQGAMASGLLPPVQYATNDPNATMKDLYGNTTIRDPNCKEPATSILAHFMPVIPPSMIQKLQLSETFNETHVTF
jgi:hypothetical protein